MKYCLFFSSEVHLTVDSEKIRQCKSFVDRAKKFVSLLYSLDVNPSVVSL